MSYFCNQHELWHCGNSTPVTSSEGHWEGFLDLSVAEFFAKGYALRYFLRRVQHPKPGIVAMRQSSAACQVSPGRETADRIDLAQDFVEQHERIVGRKDTRDLAAFLN